MQFFGNQQCDGILNSCFEQIAFGNLQQQFFVLSGEEGLGKMSMLKKHIDARIDSGVLTHQDILWIEDLSLILGKEHSLKIQLPKTKEHQVIKKSDGTLYHDKGVREIIQWLTFSPVGKAKILILEHIERMTDGASHAFLKALEEPLPGRFIFATTSNKERILDTILSRSFVLHYSPLSKEETLNFIAIQFPNISQSQKDFLFSFAIGNPGKMVRFFESFQKENFILYELFQKAILFLQAPHSFLENYAFLSPLFKTVDIKLLISGLSAYCLEHIPECAPALLSLAEKADANVSQEHLLNAFFLSYAKAHG